MIQKFNHRFSADLLVSLTDLNNATGHLELDEQPLMGTLPLHAVDATIQGLAATGIPGISQTAGAAGALWGITKIGLGIQLWHQHQKNPITDYGRQPLMRLGFSGLKSIFLGALTLEPTSGITLNFLATGISMFHMATYLGWEPHTRPQLVDLPLLIREIGATYITGYTEKRRAFIRFLARPEFKEKLIRLTRDQSLSPMEKRGVQAALDRLNRHQK